MRLGLELFNQCCGRILWRAADHLCRFVLLRERNLLKRNGWGGIGVELFQDLAWIALPASPADIRRAIAPLRLARLLAGFRGKPPADIDALVAAAAGFGARFAAATPAAEEFEINPLLVLPAGRGVVAVDALVKP